MPLREIDVTTYQSDDISSPADLFLLGEIQNEPPFDPVMNDWLFQNWRELHERTLRGGLLEFASLGRKSPWLYRLTFGTRGLVRRGPDAEPEPIERHDIALRFLPDYLRHAKRFQMLGLIGPPNAFHPNIAFHTASAGHRAICLQIYPGEGLVEICESIHELIRWRLRNLDERDALNPEACAWGRENIKGPIDDRPLFGRRLEIEWELPEEGE